MNKSTVWENPIEIQQQTFKNVVVSNLTLKDGSNVQMVTIVPEGVDAVAVVGGVYAGLKESHNVVFAHCVTGRMTEERHFKKSLIFDPQFYKRRDF